MNLISERSTEFDKLLNKNSFLNKAHFFKFCITQLIFKLGATNFACLLKMINEDSTTNKILSRVESDTLSCEGMNNFFV